MLRHAALRLFVQDHTFAFTEMGIFEKKLAAKQKTPNRMALAPSDSNVEGSADSSPGLCDRLIGGALCCLSSETVEEADDWKEFCDSHVRKHSLRRLKEWRFNRGLNENIQDMKNKHFDTQRCDKFGAHGEME